jgi:hypothetical protein
MARWAPSLLRPISLTLPTASVGDRGRIVSLLCWPVNLNDSPASGEDEARRGWVQRDGGQNKVLNNSRCKLILLTSKT